MPLINETYVDYEGNISTSILVEEDGYVLFGIGKVLELNGKVGLKMFKIDSQGNLLYKRVYGDSILDYATSEQASTIKTRDEAYVTFGRRCTPSSLCKALIVKHDLNGDTIWSRVYGGNGKYLFAGGIELDNGDLVAAGRFAVGSGPEQVWLVRMDSLGNMKWQKNYGGTSYDECNHIQLAADGGFMLAGGTSSYGAGLRDGYLIKTDSAGNMEWQKTYGTGWNEYSLNIAPCARGGYYIWGLSQDEDINGFPTYEKKTVLTKIRNDGSEVWSKILHQDFLRWGYLNQVREVDGQGNLILVGEREFSTENPAKILRLGWVTKLDSSGNKIWERYYKGPTDSINYPAHIMDFQITTEGNIACTGYAMDTGVVFGWQQNFWLLVLDSMGCLVPGCDTITGLNDISTPPLGANLYPNPIAQWRGNLTITLPNANEAHLFSLYNLLGEEVHQASLSQTSTTLHLNLPSGIYLYRITQGTQTQTGKLVVE